MNARTPQSQTVRERNVSRTRAKFQRVTLHPARPEGVARGSGAKVASVVGVLIAGNSGLGPGQAR